MPIVVHCSKCQKKINAPEHAAGRRGKCPFCNEWIAIPANQPEVQLTPAAPPTSAPTPTHETGKLTVSRITLTDKIVGIIFLVVMFFCYKAVFPHSNTFSGSSKPSNPLGVELRITPEVQRIYSFSSWERHGLGAGCTIVWKQDEAESVQVIGYDAKGVRVSSYGLSRPSSIKKGEPFKADVHYNSSSTRVVIHLLSEVP